MTSRFSVTLSEQCSIRLVDSLLLLNEKMAQTPVIRFRNFFLTP
jgi:hypothetical protein